MKLGTYLAFQYKEDLQIQTAISRLLVHIEIPNGVNPADVQFRIRALGSKGYEPVTERTSMLDLFEIAAAREGFYSIEQVLNNATPPVSVAQRFKGQVEIGVGGSLVMPAGGYLSLDVMSPFPITKMELWAVSGPVSTKSYHRLTPVTIQDTLKDVPLAGVTSIVYDPAKVRSLKFQYPDQSSDYEREELEAIGRNINDLVSVDVSSGTLVAGFNRVIEMDTEKASRVTVEPYNSGQFNILLISSQTLV